MQLWRQAARWRPGAAKLDTWLYRVALNLCHDRLRRRREIVTADPPDRADPTPTQESALESLQMARIIRAEFLALPPRQREAIALFYGEGLSGNLAAEAMGVSLEPKSKRRSSTSPALSDGPCRPFQPSRGPPSG
ncbi:MAG: sigma-70 family RNA polymerase sigma factor [Caulobacteraceae bacterium]